MPRNMSWTTVCYVLLIQLYSCYSAVKIADLCPCNDHRLCAPIDNWDSIKHEVFALTSESNLSTAYHSWNWDSITTVVKMHDHYDAALFCKSHAEGKKYGVQVELDFSIYLLHAHEQAKAGGNKTDTGNTTTTSGTDAGNGSAAVPVTKDNGTVPASKDNSTDNLLEDFVNVTVQSLKMHYADVLMLDLIKFLGNCAFAKEHEPAIIENMTTIINGIKKGSASHLKVVCVVPWKPPCYDSACSVGPALAKLCDATLLNPDSFDSYCEETCIARATVPFSKLYLAYTDYTAIGFDRSKMLIGVPWHGYKYTCAEGQVIPGSNGHFICKLPTTQNKANVTVCDVAGAREKIKYGDTWHSGVDSYSGGDHARWKVQVEYDDATKKNVTKMYWYEDVSSLTYKYNFIHEQGFKGMAIYTADDLTDSKLPTHEEAELDDHMWSWVLHSILASGPVKKEEPNFNYAGTVAGVGVGMFVFGALLATLISCIAFRRKRSLRPPFHHDTLADEFHDDDNAL